MMRMMRWTTGFLALAIALSACSTGAQSSDVVGARADSSLANARAEIEPLFQRMQTTANAHDVDGHLAAYVRDSTLVFVINDRSIRGFAALREQQSEWWQGGKSDVVYRVEGEADYRMPAPGVVVQTYFLTSHRTLADGAARDGRVAVTAIWQKRPEGWRIIYAHESSGPR
jgi:ketosteroid isomerase-like protein